MFEKYSTSDQTKRPLIIWITQILLILIAILLFIALLLNLLGLAGYLLGFLQVANNAGSLFQIVAGSILKACLTLGLLLLFSGAFWGLLKRKVYGRWLGVVSLGLVWLFMLLAQIIRPKGPLERYEYDNETQRMAGLMTQVVILGLLLWPVIYLAFSKRISAFFQPVGDEN